MGADIHMVLERKWRPDVNTSPQWVGVNAFLQPDVQIWSRDTNSLLSGHISWRPLYRNYDLFAALAGVRGDGPSPRGVPSDASPMARMGLAEWGDDAHSVTHMLMSEAMPIFVRYQFGGVSQVMHGAKAEDLLVDGMRYFFGDVSGYDGVEITSPYYAIDDLDTWRLIIWFDN